MTGLVVQTLILTLVVSGLSAIVITDPPPHSNIYSKEDVEVNLMVNQMAIMKLMESFSPERESSRSLSNLESELRQLREDMVIALQDTKYTLQQQLTSVSTEDEGEEECEVAVRGELATVKEDQVTLREELARAREELAGVKRTLAEAERRMPDTEMEEVKKLLSDIAALNISFAKHVSDAVNKEREAEESLHSELTTLKEGQATMKAVLMKLQEEQNKESNNACTTCTDEGQLHLIGCNITFCNDGCLTSHKGYMEFALFSETIGEKCAHYQVSSETWDGARDRCRVLGGDLFVASDHIDEVRNFLARISYGSIDAWLGIKNNKWLDGQDVSSEMWGSGQPNDGPDSCGFIRSDSNKLRDAPCTSAGGFMCLSGVYHS